MKAQFIEKYCINRMPVLVYEYRGYRYDVTDYGWSGGEPLAWQHRNEQARIDRMIEINAAHMSHSIENSQIGLDLFFDYYNE